MFILNDQPLSPDVAFVDANGIQRPANWLRLASPEEREEAGISEAPDPPFYDQRFSWGYSEDGDPIWKDHDQLVEQWIEQTRSAANSLIQPTDWMVIREADNGSVVDPAVKTWRQDLRLAAGEKIEAIEATTSTEELASYITGADFPSWPRDPRLPEPVVVEGLSPAPVE